MRTDPNKAHPIPARKSPLLALARLAALLVTIAVAGGCATTIREYFANGFKVGPNYCPAEAPVAEHWIDYQDSRVHSVPPVDWAWWRIFNDPVLDELVQISSRQNITLREAGFRIEEARAQRAIAVGNLFPQQQTVSGSYTRRMNSLGTNIAQ